MDVFQCEILKFSLYYSFNRVSREDESPAWAHPAAGAETEHGVQSQQGTFQLLILPLHEAAAQSKL